MSSTKNLRTLGSKLKIEFGVVPPFRVTHLLLWLFHTSFAKQLRGIGALKWVHRRMNGQVLVHHEHHSLAKDLDIRQISQAHTAMINRSEIIRESDTEYSIGPSELHPPSRVRLSWK